MSQNKKDQATRDREALDKIYDQMLNRPEHLNPLRDFEFVFEQALAYARQLKSDEVRELYEAAKSAKEHLKFELKEPGRSVFWRLFEALAKFEAATKDSDEG